jgi:hypothetical protein
MQTTHVKVRTEDGEFDIRVHGGYSELWYTEGLLEVGDYCEGVDGEGRLRSGVVTEVLL